MERPETEILVHIAAPARAADDVRYRALARAYLDFEPAVFTEILPKPRTDFEDDTQPNRGELVGFGIDQPQPSSQLARGIESPILSFRSAEHNFNSPRLRVTSVLEHDITETRTSWQAPPSEVPDSMPDNNVEYGNFHTPSRVLDFFTSSVESQQLESSPLARRRSQRLATATQSGSQLQSQPRRSLRRRYFPAKPPESSSPQRSSVPQPSLPQLTARPSSPQPSPYQGQTGGPSQNQLRTVPPSSLNKELHLPSPSDAANKVIPRSPDICVQKRPPTQTSQPSTGEIIEETVLYSSFPSQASVPPSSEPPQLNRADSEPVTKRRRTAVDPEPGQALARSKSDIGPQRPLPNPQFRSNHPSQYYANKLTILSPPPPTAQHELEPSDVISEVLSKLAIELDLPTRFQLAKKTREPRPFERGYWHVDTTSWPSDLKKSAWTFLTDYIEKGIAGWGTSCSRNKEYSWIKFRCWGCVVGHMYLVIYVASRRQVKYTGMKWVGGDGEVVVVMPAR
ncbi:hypothetical protein B0T21DRAFT_365676 [Apiosordaria backusii]|uniref:Uncharacterized protein n=1 Tax=Apiosordaria backusii TaxID=314023 RepID=A0AA40EH54_9PEZI|nr:hypothetical protein B0T21DRAFT_365676 [Apiosordaria backusii]